MNPEKQQLADSIRSLKEQIRTIEQKAEMVANAQFRMIGGNSKNRNIGYWRERLNYLLAKEREKRQPTIDRLNRKLEAQKALLERKAAA